ncbi:MAG: 2-C-methyl-D-erythritol 2,4-cyclodiphosphate synthase [Colwellia sp.]
MRIGHGYDVHKFGGKGPLMLCGVAVPFEQGFIAHSDGDVAIHALIDAILGALCLGDIGNHFPDTDQTYANISSKLLLEPVVKIMHEHGFQIGNVDLTIVAQAPKMSPHLQPMRASLSETLLCGVDQINVKATTTEGLGFAGRKEGIEVHCVVLLMPKASNNESLDDIQTL